jgi:hypothetical protein
MSQIHEEPERGTTISTPRWVKVFVITAIALVLLVVILHLTGSSLGSHDNHTPSIERGVQLP